MSSLVRHLAPECVQALLLARRSLPTGRRLDVPTVLDALFHATSLHDDPDMLALEEYFPEPKPLHDDPPPTPVDENLKSVLSALRGVEPVSPLRLFSALALSEAGMFILRQRGLELNRLASLPGFLPPAFETDELEEHEHEGRTLIEPPANLSHRAALMDLAPFGTVLTAPPGPPQFANKIVPDSVMAALLQYLYTPRSRNILLVAPPGTGKTSILRHLAAKIIARDPSLPVPVLELDLFELSPMFPRQIEGEASFGPGVELSRVWRLLRTLQAAPGVVLCVDRLVSFLNLLFRLSVHMELVDGFRQAMDDGSITCIGGAHPEDIDKVAELDRSLLRRFRTLHLPSPSSTDVVQILNGRLGKLEEHFQPLKVPPEVLPRVVGLADQHLRGRSQPEKSLRLLEASCARAALESLHGGETPPVLHERHVLQSLEGFIGPVVLPSGGLTSENLFAQMRENIVGQDDGLRELAEAVVAGRSDAGWYMRPGPRGVFLLGGPTGVGKTETAMVLSRILGGGQDALVRVDCQNLQGSGSGWEANTLTWRLLGVAPGYRGHVPGCRDGLLVRVRDYPECVLLFDEFEKADSTVGRLILRILDEGKAQDSEGNEIDFRRCLVILTSNVGVSYTDPERGTMIFGRPAGVQPPAVVTEQSVSEGLLATGLGQEFLGRVQHFVLYRALTDDHIREIITRQLDKLKDLATARGKELEWTDAAVNRLASRWKERPHLGARYLGTLVRIQVLDPLNVAASSGELGPDLHRIVLDAEAGPSASADGRVPRSERRRDGDRYRIVLQ